MASDRDCVCLHCGYHWTTRLAPPRLPPQCARCHSAAWNRPPTHALAIHPGDPNWTTRLAARKREHRAHALASHQRHRFRVLARKFGMEEAQRLLAEDKTFERPPGTLEKEISSALKELLQRPPARKLKAATKRALAVRTREEVPDAANRTLAIQSDAAGDPPSGERVGAIDVPDHLRVSFPEDVKLVGLPPPPRASLPPPPRASDEPETRIETMNLPPLNAISDDDDRALRARRRDALLRSVGAKR